MRLRFCGFTVMVNQVNAFCYKRLLNREIRDFPLVYRGKKYD